MELKLMKIMQTGSTLKFYNILYLRYDEVIREHQ
jgi:hypothetical protein